MIGPPQQETRVFLCWVSKATLWGQRPSTLCQPPISIASQFSVITQPRGSSYVRSWDGMAQGCKSFKFEGFMFGHCKVWELQDLGAVRV